MIRTHRGGRLFTLLFSLATLGGGILPGCSGDGGREPQLDFAVVDLSAHVSQTVEISFHMMASPVTNRAGWYIDDMALSGS